MTDEPKTEPQIPEDPDVEPEETLPEIELQDLPQGIQETVTAAGWTDLMPVQRKAIPYLRAGQDIMVQSRTGSGKTAAFVIPILERIDPQDPQTQALVLVPTRELAKQVAQEAEWLSKGTGVRTVAVYGGVGYGAQLDALKEGAHFVVGTPGRILDHLIRRSLNLDPLKYLVFDEADRMLSVGFYPDIKAIEPFLPKKRHSFLFSATYPPRVRGMASEFLQDPELLSLSTGAVHALNTAHEAHQIQPMDKDRYLVRLIEIKNPDSALIFCNTKDQVRFVTVVLQRRGYDADMLSADLTQKAREQVLEKIHKKELRFLVATDVAARGIDIDNLSHVFLYDFPEDPESYIHRTGRTGRAGASGEAISLVDSLELLQLKAVARQYEMEIPLAPPVTDEIVEKVVTERVIALLEAKVRNLDGLVRERLTRMMPLAKSLGESEDERKLVAMLLDEFYQESLHAPVLGRMPDPPKPKPEKQGRGRSGSGRSGGGRSKQRRGSRRRR